MPVTAAPIVWFTGRRKGEQMQEGLSAFRVSSHKRNATIISCSSDKRQIDKRCRGPGGRRHNDFKQLQEDLLSRLDGSLHDLRLLPRKAADVRPASSPFSRPSRSHLCLRVGAGVNEVSSFGGALLSGGGTCFM